MPFSTSGGGQITTENIIDGEIINDDISSSANISLDKLNNVAYKVLADVTLASAGVTLDSGTITAKTHLRVIVLSTGHAVAGSWSMRFNGDTGANYNYSVSENGGAASLNAAATSIPLAASALTDLGHATVDIINLASFKKSVLGLQMTEVYCRTIGAQWENTSNQITQITITATNNFAIGSRLIVLGMN